MNVPIHFLKLQENIEKKILDDFTKPLITHCDIEYYFENIHVRIYPTIIGKFQQKGWWFGTIEYDIVNTPNKMVEKVIHNIFKHLNGKYYDTKITDKEIIKSINDYFSENLGNDIIYNTPSAI